MKRILLTWVLLAGLVLPAGAVSFNKDVRPILADRCFACHGPDASARKAGLRLDQEMFAKAALADSGIIPVVAGKPGESGIITRITSDDPQEVMPPPESKSALSAREIGVIREWIASGAQWERHWALIAPQKSALPDKGAGERSSNWIDRFILERLRVAGIQPSPRASAEHLLRRLTFDLTGLPPKIEQLDAFLADHGQTAYKRMVEQLLSSPAFGERLALEWLDVARYGDTDGLFEDHPRSIYPWRDWVVRAFNQNLPYSDFISWQLAGDLYPSATVDQRLATGFLRNNPTSNEGGIIDEDYRVKYLIDRVNTTATAFLGLTMECAQCHDHKFDPITQREYYEMAGFFNNLVGKGNTKGATAPTLSILQPGHLERMKMLDKEIMALEAIMVSSPPQLMTDFDLWLGQLEKAIDWYSPQVLADSRRAQADLKDSPPAVASEVRGRYLRLALPRGKSGFITISEIQVYSEGHNIARAGSATQSSNYSGATLAAKAVDGNADGTFGSCACTQEEKDAWWELDLGAEVPIDHIVVYNRGDCCPERLDHVSVTLLDKTRKIVTEHNTGDAPSRLAFSLNPEAPLPKSTRPEYMMVLAPRPGPVAAISLSGFRPGLLDSIKLELLSATGESRELKLAAVGETRFDKENPAVLGLEKPEKLDRGHTLKLSLSGDPVREVRLTAQRDAANRKKIPQGRDKRLAHFRGNWPGFAGQRRQLETLKKEKASIEKPKAISMIAADAGKMRPNHILLRGEYDKRGEAVPTSAPGSIMPFSPKLPKNRLGLAGWMVDSQNPLTARVVVNRYWQMIFGVGLVKTSEDFGAQGERPSHQELLDHLAVDFIDSGWDIKHLIRTIVTSATYQQSSVLPRGIIQIDPGNRLLSHAPRHRLAAEFVRDHALSVSGLLVDKLGGPGVNPYQPSVLFGRNAIGASNVSFAQSKGEGLYRRSLYTYWKRQIPAANMRILGSDGRNSCRTRRESTNTPLQALVLLNDPQFVEAARGLAERCFREGGESAEERLAYAFRLSTSRSVAPAELKVLLAEYRERLAEFRNNPAAANSYISGGGERPADTGINPVELAAYAAVVSLILNLDESISKS